MASSPLRPAMRHVGVVAPAGSTQLTQAIGALGKNRPAGPTGRPGDRAFKLRFRQVRSVALLVNRPRGGYDSQDPAIHPGTSIMRSGTKSKCIRKSYPEDSREIA